MPTKNKSKYRVDRLDVELSKMTKNDKGYLKGTAFLTSTDVYPYFDESGNVSWEARLPRDVFHKDSIKSMEMLAVTIEHPFEVLDSHNTSKYQIGHLGSEIKVHSDGVRLYAPIMITDARAVEEIEKGKRLEISMGYEVLMVREDGVYRDKPYTYKHTNIKYNHVALTVKGRAGDTIRLVTDSKVNALHFDSIYKTKKPNKNQTKGVKMDEDYILDGVTHTIPSVIVAHIKKKDSTLESLLSAKKTDSTTMANIKNQNEELKAKADRLENDLEIEKKKDHSQEIETALKIRRDLESTARNILKSDSLKTIGDLTNKELKISIIKFVHDTFTGKNDAGEDFEDSYIDAYLRGVVDTAGKNKTGDFNHATAKSAPKGDTGTPKNKTDKAQNEMLTDIYDWDKKQKNNTKVGV